MLELSTSNELVEIKKELGWQFKTLGLMGATLWGLELVDTYILHQALNAYGIAPGKISGLIGVLTAPFLHGSLVHLAANTIPLMPKKKMLANTIPVRMNQLGRTSGGSNFEPDSLENHFNFL